MSHRQPGRWAAGAGHMRLQSTDPYQQPFLDYNYLKEESDRVRLRDLACACACNWRIIRRVPGHDPGEHRATRGPLVRDEALDAWIAREVTTSASTFPGTCKMGPDSDPMAVVDQFGKGQGHYQGLRVADAQRNARLHPRQHQRDLHDHRRARRRVHQGRTLNRSVAGVDNLRPCATTWLCLPPENGPASRTWRSSTSIEARCPRQS